jgi:hypothetical protein
VSFAWYKRIDDEARESEEGVARSCDVSQDGLGLVTTRVLPVGSRVLVELITETGNLSVVGTVRHCSPREQEQVRIGVFVEIVPPTDKLTWRRLRGY